jgi:O-methyltransferase
MAARSARRMASNVLSSMVRVVYRGRLDKREHAIIIPESSWSPWRADAEFVDALSQVRAFTLVDEMRLYELWDLAGQLRSVPGDVLEVGVWRGGSGCLLALQCARGDVPATVFLCDTFSGVVQAGDEDPIYEGGEHSDTSAELVDALAAHLGLDNVRVLVGTFPDDTADAIADRRFKLCHLDVDVYAGSKASLEWAWPRLVPGGVVVVDDYGGDGMDGVRHAVDEFVGRVGCRMTYNLNGHAVLVKDGAGN